jgi:thiamine biosynthesis lipoprotein
MVQHKYSQEVLGTLFTLSFSKKTSNGIIDSCFDELKRIENKFTRFNFNSELMKLNSHLFKWQDIDDEFKELLLFAEKIYLDTEGYFDISQKNTLEKFGYGLTSAKSKFNQVRSKCYTRNYSIKNNNIKLFEEIEIGGFGKGYALKKLRDILEKEKIKNYILDAGGDIYVNGLHEIHLESPYNKENVFAKITLEDTCICSSSPSRRQFNSKHHLITPKTQDSSSNLLQVYIKHVDPMYCDALSTALFVMGFDLAKEYTINNSLQVLLVSNDEMYSTLDIKYLS